MVFPNMGSAVRLLFRTLTFRVTREELLRADESALLLGLFCTWMAGMGRYWDNPKAELLQQLGAGSVVYVFVLAAFLYLVVWPLRPANWSYISVLTFITLTAPPAFLYAIPVQMLFPEPDLYTANAINAWFLGIVSVWRLGLLGLFYTRVAQLPWFERIIGVLFPVMVIIVIITMLNLEKVVFNIMGGTTEIGPNDVAYEIMVMITFFSSMGILPVFIAYLGAIGFSRKKRRRIVNSSSD